MQPDLELNSLEMLMRYRQCARAITLSEVGLEIMVTLASHPDGWSVNSLADVLGVSRATVYNRLAIVETAGFGARDNAGHWRMNDAGRNFLRMFMAESRQIAHGERAGFSDRFIAILSAIPGPERRARAVAGAKSLRYKQISEYKL